MREEGPAKLDIQIKSDQLLIFLTFVAKSPGYCQNFIVMGKKFTYVNRFQQFCEVLKRQRENTVSSYFFSSVTK